MREIAEYLYNLASDMDAGNYEEKHEKTIEQMVSELKSLPKDSVLVSCLQVLTNLVLDKLPENEITIRGFLKAEKVVNLIAQYESKNIVNQNVTYWFGDYAMWGYATQDEDKIIDRLKYVISSEFKGNDDVEKQLRFIDWLLDSEVNNIYFIRTIATTLKFDELYHIVTYKPEVFLNIKDNMSK